VHFTRADEMLRTLRQSLLDNSRDVDKAITTDGVSCNPAF
jgi:hypothetical protein